MAAYVIGDIKITDPEKYAEYAVRVPATSEAYGVRYLVRGVGKCESLPLFDQAVESGRVDRPALDSIKKGMKEWSELPHAFIAKGRCVALGQK